jgi:hypothetical protein
MLFNRIQYRRRRNGSHVSELYDFCCVGILEVISDCCFHVDSLLIVGDELRDVSESGCKEHRLLHGNVYPIAKSDGCEVVAILQSVSKRSKSAQCSRILPEFIRDVLSRDILSEIESKLDVHEGNIQSYLMGHPLFGLLLEDGRVHNDVISNVSSITSSFEEARTKEFHPLSKVKELN